MFCVSLRMRSLPDLLPVNWKNWEIVPHTMESEECFSLRVVHRRLRDTTRRPTISSRLYDLSLIIMNYYAYVSISAFPGTFIVFFSGSWCGQTTGVSREEHGGKWEELERNGIAETIEWFVISHILAMHRLLFFPFLFVLCFPFIRSICAFYLFRSLSLATLINTVWLIMLLYSSWRQSLILTNIYNLLIGFSHTYSHFWLKRNNAKLIDCSWCVWYLEAVIYS